MIIKLSASRVFLLMIAYIFGAETLLLYVMPPGEFWVIPAFFFFGVLWAVMVTAGACLFTVTTFDHHGVEQSFFGVIVRQVRWNHLKSAFHPFAIKLKGDSIFNYVLWPKPWLQANPTEIRQELNRLQIPEPIRKKLT